jgi:3D-(3,5/4)-trihydroxycyclohexane-1,2-dione acylhydrolase (decyclizing)
MMACTSSIGPGASNMVTAAAVAHVNRLPVLFLPGDVFASRRPDPVLQQVESFSDATASVNDAFRPVSRFFDRITRPEQLLTALPAILGVLTDPAMCGPVTLALCQDTQAEAFDWPESFFAPRVWHLRRSPPDATELRTAADALRVARAPLLITGGGVLYSEAEVALARFAERHRIPIVETQAGKGALPDTHALNLGAIGVTGSAAANQAAEAADVILAVGTRLQDFTTGSRTLFRGRLIGLNVQPFDAGKHDALPLVADAREGIASLDAALGEYRAPVTWEGSIPHWRAEWRESAEAATAPGNRALPTDAQVIGAVQRGAPPGAVVVCAAGGLPGELHKLWRAEGAGTYHLEYGYSCMGYEIAGGLGVKMANPSREVIVMVGDGSYLMMNSEIATSVTMGMKLTIVLLDNGGFGCISRLQEATGGAAFNNLMPHGVDLRAHAAAMGAIAETATDLASLEETVRHSASNSRTTVIVIETDPTRGTEAGGHWWDVAVPEISQRAEVQAARTAYNAALSERQR